MSQVKSGCGGCLAFAICGVVGTVAIGWGAMMVARLYSPADPKFPASVAIIVGVDVLALTVVAYVAHSNPKASRQHNTALRVCLTFAALGAMTGQGYGLYWLCAVAATNALLGMLAWWVLVYRTVPNP